MPPDVQPRNPIEMLESLVATVLNRVVGAYVEDFDAKQLNIGLLSGDVKLRSLKMKRSALDKLHLPINVVEGHIGSLILQIPYSNLKNKPVKVLIEDVFVLAHPDLNSDDDVDFKRRQQRAKLDQLELWEVTQAAKDSEPQAQNTAQTSGFVAKIIDNLQVTIKSIHVRYEDAECVPDHPFAMGFTLGELSAVSTTKDWEPAFISEITPISHKLATLDSLALYWDTDATPMKTTDHEFRRRITDASSTNQYLLCPVNGQGFVTLDKQPASESTPRINADLQFEEFAVGLDGGQYRDFIGMADQYQLYFRTREYRQYRPKESPSEDPKAWWSYAINTVLKNVEEKTRPWTWEYLVTRLADMKEYGNLYKKQSIEGSLDADQKSQFNAIQENYSYGDLVLFRTLAKFELKNQSAKSKLVNDSKKAVSSWSSWFWSNPPQGQDDPTEAPTENNEDGPIEITEKQKQELYDLFDLNDNGKGPTLNQILFATEVSLQSGSVRLRQEPNDHSEVASLFFNGSKGKIIKRSDNLLFGLSLASFGIKDLTQESKFPDVVSLYKRSSSPPSTPTPFFWLMYEYHPLDGIADSSLSIKSKPVTIVYSSHFIDQIIKFFTPPAGRSEAVDAIVSSAAQTVEELREQTRLGLEHALEEHKSLSVKLDIDAPIIVLPENAQVKNSPVSILDAGHLSLNSELASPQVIEEVRSKQAQKYTKADWLRLESLMYDKFRISLTDAQILVGPEYDSTMAQLHGGGISNFHILNRATLEFVLEVSIVPKNPSLPKCRMNINLPSLHMSFADVQYKQIMQTIQNAVPTTGSSEASQTNTSVLVPRNNNIDFVLDEDGRSTKVSRHPSRKDQVVFELKFSIELAELKVVRGWDCVPLVDISLNMFSLHFDMKDGLMGVQVDVQGFLIEDFVNTKAPAELRKFVESDGYGEERNKESLLKVNYSRNERGKVVEQSVDVSLATMRFMLNPDTLITVYDYIMSTFTSPTDPQVESQVTQSSDDTANAEVIHVKVSLQSIVGKVVDDGIVIDTLELASAKIFVDLLGTSMKFQCVLGAVSIVDELNSGTKADSLARQLVSIEGGGDLADIRYETYDPSTDPDYDAFVYFRTGSLRLSVVEEPITRLVRSLSRLAQMKTLYDQARMMAFDQAIQFDPPERMKFDIVVSTPIIVYPRFCEHQSCEKLTANLGEIFLQNEFKGDFNEISAGIRNCNLSSEIEFDGQMQQLQILGGTDLTANASWTKKTAPRKPNVTGHASLTPIAVNITEFQLQFFMQFINTVSTIAASSGGLDTTEVSQLQETLATQKHLDQNQTKQVWNQEDSGAKDPTSVKFDFDAPSFAVALYTDTSLVKSADDLENKILSKSLLDRSVVKFQMDKKGNIKADLTVKAFTVEDKRTIRENKFPQIIPPASHSEQQLLCRYTQSPNRTPNLDVSLDGMKAILALDYLFALQNFMVQGTNTIDKHSHGPVGDDSSDDESLSESEESDDEQAGNVQSSSDDATQSQSLLFGEPPITVSVSIVDMYIMLLADASKWDSEAIVFKIEHVVLSYNRNSSLGISRIGMYLTKMNDLEENHLRILDDFNITASTENMESSEDCNLARINAHVDPLVVRVSLREVLLAVDIFNKASALWKDDTPLQEKSSTSKVPTVFTNDGSKPYSSAKSRRMSHGRNASVQSTQQSRPGSNVPKVFAEQFEAEFSGFRMVIIDAVHQLPMTDFFVKPFTFTAHNWTSDLSAKSKIDIFANAYSFAKSAWEPLIDKINLLVYISKPSPEMPLSVSFQTKGITNVDVTPDLISMYEGVLSYFNEPQDLDSVFSKGRFEGCPYRIINQTGFPIEVWSDSSECQESSRTPSTIENNAKVKWSFYDWRKLREDLSSMSQEVNLHVVIKGSGFRPLHNVNVNIVGEHLYELVSEDSHDKAPHRLVCEIYVKENLKYIVIRSSVSLCNETKLPLEIKLSEEGGAYDGEVLTLEPGKYQALPIPAVDYDIFVRPKVDGYNWSNEPLFWKNLRRNPVHAECDGQADKFFLYVTSFMYRQVPLQAHYPYMVINFCAPIEIINNLPFDFDYRLSCSELKKTYDSNIAQGARKQIHVVSRKQNLIMSIFSKESGYQTSDRALINVSTPEFTRDDRFTLKGPENTKLHLDLKYVDLPDNKGQVIVLLAPYVILNFTGSKVVVSTRLNHVVCGVSANIDKDSVQSDPKIKYQGKPSMWSFERPDKNNKAVIRVDDSNWSSPVSFTAIGTSSELAVPSRDRQNEMYLGITLEEGSGRYKRTNVVTIAPRFTLCNRLNKPLRFKEPGEIDTIGILDPQEFRPVRFVSSISNRQMCLSLSGPNARWSSAFVMSNTGTTYLRLIEKGSPTVLVKIDIVMEGASLFIYLQDAGKNWPYSIRNLTDQEFEFYQANPFVDEDGVENRKFNPIKYRLPSMSAMPYSWDFPAAKIREIVLQSGAKRRRITLAEIGELEPAKFPDAQGNMHAVDLNVVANGPVQALVITPHSSESSNYDLVRSTTRATSKSNQSTQMTTKFELNEEDDSKSAFRVQVDIEDIGVSYVDQHHRELCYATFRNLGLIYRLSDLFEYVAVRCQWIQVDNCLNATSEYPVILYPTVVPQTEMEMKQHPIISASATRLVDDDYGLMFVKHATALLQELTIEVDEDLLVAALQMIKHPSEGEILREDQSSLCPTILHIPTPPAAYTTNDLYFELLHLQPVQLNLSFMRTGALTDNELFGDFSTGLNYVLDALTMALGNINDAPLRFNALLVENLRTTPEQLQLSVTTHYREDVIKQLYKVVGSVDIFGNPVGLFNNISSGVADLFYEPYLGYTSTDRPQDLGLGIAKGGISFVKKSVFGVSDSVSKVTGSLSKGLAAFTMDPAFQRRRRSANLRNHPSNAFTGISYGATNLANSLVSGISGLALNPLEGATTDGVQGFFRGLGKGLVGLPTKSAIGILDFASNLSEGVRNNTTVFDTNVVCRARPPRVVQLDGVIRPYSERDAIGQSILFTVRGGRYETDSYIAYTSVSSGEVVIVSYERILCVSVEDVREKWQVTYSELRKVILENTGISLKLSRGIQGPFIPLTDPESRNYINTSIATAVAHYNLEKSTEC